MTSCAEVLRCSRSKLCETPVGLRMTQKVLLNPNTRVSSTSPAHTDMCLCFVTRISGKYPTSDRTPFRGHGLLLKASDRIRVRIRGCVREDRVTPVGSLFNGELSRCQKPHRRSSVIEVGASPRGEGVPFYQSNGSAMMNLNCFSSALKEY